MFVFCTFEATRHGQHGQVQHLGHVRLITGGHDGLEREDRRSRLRRFANILQNLSRLFVVPVVDH